MYGLEEWSPCRSLSPPAFNGGGCPVLPPSFGGRESVGENERHTEFGLQARQLSRIGNGGACPRFCCWLVTDKPQIPATRTRIRKLNYDAILRL